MTHDLFEDDRGVPVEMMGSGVFQGGALISALVWVMVWPRPPIPRDDLLATSGFCGVGAAIGGRCAWAGVAMLRGESALAREGLLDVWGGGFSSLGALCGALVVAAVIYGRRRELWSRLADFFVPIALLTLALARLGCVARGCDFGEVWQGAGELAVRYHAHDSPAWRWFASQGELLADGGSPALFPMASSLSLFTALGVAVVCVCTRREVAYASGTRAAWCVLMYSCVRVCLEAFRHPQAGAHVHGVNINMVAASLGGVIALVWLLRARLAS